MSLEPLQFYKEQHENSKFKGASIELIKSGTNFTTVGFFSFSNHSTNENTKGVY